jgi:hypothetical protein
LTLSEQRLLRGMIQWSGMSVAYLSRWFVALALSGFWLAGCRTGQVPGVDASWFEARLSPIPNGAAPVYAWHGQRQGLKTYWGDQDVRVAVQAHIPADWAAAGDGFWMVKGETAGGRVLAFLGLVHEYQNENGTDVAVLVPEIDLDKVKDGLYLVCLPGVTMAGDQSGVTEVAPKLLLCEIRNHSFKPFRVEIPLRPQQTTDVTPDPGEWPLAPVGTPIPIH